MSNSDDLGDVEYFGRVAQKPAKVGYASDYVKDIRRRPEHPKKPEAKNEFVELTYERFEDQSSPWIY